MDWRLSNHAEWYSNIMHHMFQANKKYNLLQPGGKITSVSFCNVKKWVGLFPCLSIPLYRFPVSTNCETRL